MVGFVFLVVVLHVALPAAANAEVSGEEVAKVQEVQGGKRDCVCMNWRNCHGSINSDVNCGQSYLQICCIVNKNPNQEELKLKLPQKQIL